jgi:protein involved in plasmid replication-relaxation
MTTRQPRSQRRSGVSLVITPRDEAVLRAVSRFRLCRTSDLGRLFFRGRNRDVLAARLRRLFDAQYLEAHVPDRAAENLYTLGPEGKERIRSTGGCVGAVPRPPWEHHLGIVRLWSMIASATHEMANVQLASFCPEWEVREQPKVRGAAIVPDALLEVRAPALIRVAVEVDRGTESLEILRRKFQSYTRHRMAGGLLGWPAFELMIVLQDGGVRRERLVRELLAREWLGRPLLWTGSEAAVELSSLFKAPVTDPRSGSGRGGTLNTDAASAPEATGGEPSDHD